jgi:hypothetical protein
MFVCVRERDGVVQKDSGEKKARPRLNTPVFLVLSSFYIYSLILLYKELD